MSGAPLDSAQALAALAAHMIEARRREVDTQRCSERRRGEGQQDSTAPAGSAAAQLQSACLDLRAVGSRVSEQRRALRSYFNDSQLSGSEVDPTGALQAGRSALQAAVCRAVKHSSQLSVVLRSMVRG